MQFKSSQQGELNTSSSIIYDKTFLMKTWSALDVTP